VSTRFVVVVRAGLVEELYADAESDIQLLIVDHDAREFGDEDEDRVSLLDGDRVWVTDCAPVIDPWFVSRVFQTWE